MKRNLFIYLLAWTLLLGGCATGQPARLEYIGADAAKAAALEAAGITAGQVEFNGTDMATREGVDYYRVTFTDPSTALQMQYDIDALTGVIIEHRITAKGTPADSPAAGSSGDPGPEPQPPEGSLVSDADTYGPAAQQPPAQSPQQIPGDTTGKSEAISVEEAKSIALAHAGLTAEQVIFVKNGLDWDDGRQTYDLEFYTGDYREFDYDIDPYTGAVLSFDHDAEYYTPPASGGSGAISADEAKAKALAQVPGATADNIREFEVDYDDGRVEYEGKIYYDHMEYEFEIDGYSGAIRTWEVESIYDD